MARGRRGSGARGNRGRKSRTSRTSNTSSRSRNTRGSGARGNRGRTTSTKTTRTSKTTNTKSTRTSQGTTTRSNRGPNYSGLAKKLGVHPSVIKNRAKVRDAAAARHAKFKQTRVQTFGGRKTNFTKAEQKRITDAGYSVKGYSKAAPRSNTQLQVDRDNAMYGNTVPAGSFNISAAGRAQAEANKEAARKEATRKSTFSPGRLPLPGGVFNPLNAFTPEGKATMLAGYADAAVDAINFGKNVLTAGYAKDKFNLPKLPAYKDAGQQFLRNVSSVALPLAQGRANLARFKSVDPISGKAGFANEIAKMRLPNQGKYAFSNAPGAFRPKLTAKGIEGVNISTIAQSIFNPTSLITGPTAGGTIALNAAMTGATVGDKAKSGGLNIGGAAQASEGGVDSGEAKGSNTGRTLTARFNKPGLDTLAGGLDFATNDRFDFDNLGKGLFGYGAVTPSNVINDAMSIAQNKNLTVKDMGTFLNTVKDVSTSDDKLGTVKNILSNQDTTARLLGPVYDQLRNSEIVDSLATKKLGLPDNYGEQLDQTKGALETAYNKLGTDDKANRRIISDLFIGKDPNLNLLKRGAEQFTNQSGTIANYQDKTNLAKFQDSFKENSPLFKGLNKDERGMIGSLGNWRLSNLGTKIVGQNLEGTNNIADLASNIIDTAGTNKATQSFLKTIGVKGAPTPKTIIEGAIPKFGNRSSESNAINRLRSSVGSSATTLAAATPTSVEQILPLPTTATQTGTNSGNLGGIMQNAYQNQMSLYGMNPNYFANIMQPRFNRPMKRFRQVFNRGYF